MKELQLFAREDFEIPASQKNIRTILKRDSWTYWLYGAYYCQHDRIIMEVQSELRRSISRMNDVVI